MIVVVMTLILTLMNNEGLGSKSRADSKSPDKNSKRFRLYGNKYFYTNARIFIIIFCLNILEFLGRRRHSA